MPSETGVFEYVGGHDKVLALENKTLGIHLEIDYDDVNHYEIDEYATLILKALNRYVTEDEWILARFKAKKIQKEAQMEDLGYA